MESAPSASAAANHYQLLGVGPLAPQDLIVEAYWMRSRPPGKPVPPESLLKRLNEAYATLVDPERRDAYNESLGLPVPSSRHLWQETLRAPHEWLQIDPVSGRDLVPLAYSIMREHWLEAVAMGRVKRDVLRQVDAARDALTSAEAPAPTAASSPAAETPRRLELAVALRSGIAGLARGVLALVQGPPMPLPEPAVENGAAEERISTLTPAEPEPAPAPRAPEPEQAPPAFLRRAGTQEPAQATTAPAPRTAPAADVLVPVKSAPAESIEGAYLTWTTASGEAVAAPIEEFLRVGTHNLCEIRLVGETMPEELVRIWRDPDGRYVLRHMPASGVVSINGKPMIWAELEDGDVIDLCGVPVTFRQPASVGARSASS